MFLGNFGAVRDARCLDTEAGMGGYPGLRCVKIYLLSYRCFTNGDGCCTTLTESIVEGPAMTFRPALRGVTAFPAFPAHETRKLSSTHNRLRRLWHAVEVSVVALEQSQGCVQATTATSWHVMLILLQLRELLRPLELSRTPERRLRR
jgi:hypothetical protein